MGGKGSGRKKTPDHVLAKRGSPRRSKKQATRSGPKTKAPPKDTPPPNDDGTLKVPAQQIRMPPWIPKGLARTTWRKMLPIVQAMRIMTVADVPLLARYCVVYARWQATESWLDEQSAAIGTPEYARTNRQALNLAGELRRLERSLGLNPSARRRLGRALAPSGNESPEEQRERMKRLQGGKAPEVQEGPSRFFKA